MTGLFSEPSVEQLTLPDGELELFRSPDLGTDYKALFETLEAQIAWREESIRLYGKTYVQPRLLAWYGDPEAQYSYSGRRYDPLPWISPLADMKDRIETLSGARYNSVLANLYRNERDSMGLHADDEPELGAEPVIASLSLGEERVFRMKHRHRKEVKPVRIPLTSGSLLLMRGKTQQYWKHEVPKQRVACGPRINLTFRWIHSEANK
ncbi:MAG: alpha-ketoglutarate-dependent dioxygenase AlkB [Pseudomonadota bacterium]